MKKLCVMCLTHVNFFSVPSVPGCHLAVGLRHGVSVVLVETALQAAADLLSAVTRLTEAVLTIYMRSCAAH